MNEIRLKNIANFMLQQALLWITPINIILNLFCEALLLPLRTLRLDLFCTCIYYYFCMKPEPLLKHSYGLIRRSIT